MSDRVDSQQVFFNLLRAGLWEQEARLSAYGEIDFAEVMRVAEEQSVIGLVTAGIEQVTDVRVEKMTVIPYMQRVLVLENTNSAMNEFVASLFRRYQLAGISALLVRGQGIARCYARPQWRAPGDVDLLLNAENYERAKSFLTPLASSVDPEGIASLHYGMELESWHVELHGTMRCGLSSRMDRSLDRAQEIACEFASVRPWCFGGVEIPLPGPDEDVVFCFTHFVKHFYKGGLGLRQICDWCRLLWTFYPELDLALLEARLREMRLVSQWKAFGAFAVEYLGLPAEAMPLYSPAVRWRRKARWICAFVMEVGNMGHNRDDSYWNNPYLVRKFFSMARRLGDLCRHFWLFPLDSLRFMPRILFNGVRSAVRGE